MLFQTRGSNVMTPITITRLLKIFLKGYGSTFDGINLTNGYHPLWMLVCIPIFALARFDLILPLRVLLMVIAVFHAGTSVLLYRLVKNIFRRQWAF
jgi:hypothetical protein